MLENKVPYKTPPLSQCSIQPHFIFNLSLACRTSVHVSFITVEITWLAIDSAFSCAQFAYRLALVDL